MQMQAAKVRLRSELGVRGWGRGCGYSPPRDLVHSSVQVYFPAPFLPSTKTIFYVIISEEIPYFSLSIVIRS